MRGAYGFRLAGARSAGPMLVPVPPDWPVLGVQRRIGSVVAARAEIGNDRARVPLMANGLLTLDRRSLRAVFTTREPLGDEELVHPYLAPAAAVAARWLGRETFHAGALVVAGGAWGVLGRKDAGKSSLLAWLALNGSSILADDALVIGGRDAFAGPRSVDMREETANVLGVGDPLGVVGDRARWRLRLDDVPAAAPLRGWIFLEWSGTAEVVRLRGREVLVRLMDHRMVRAQPADPLAMLELAALPAFVLRRPRGWDEIGDNVERLLAELP